MTYFKPLPIIALLCFSLALGLLWYWNSDFRSERQFQQLTDVISKENIETVRNAIADLNSKDINSIKSAQGHTLVYAAILNKRHPEVIELFSAFDLDLTVEVDSGIPLLHFAIHNDNPIAVRFLIKSGFDLQLKDRVGQTAKKLCEGALKHQPTISSCLAFMDEIEN